MSKDAVPHHRIHAELLVNGCVRHSQNAIDNVDESIDLRDVWLNNGGIHSSAFNCHRLITSAVRRDIEEQIASINGRDLSDLKCEQSMRKRKRMQKSLTLNSHSSFDFNENSRFDGCLAGGARR